MMQDSAEERARKRSRTKVGGEVPADSDKFVTEAVQAIRDRAAKRQAAKEQPRAVPKTKAVARPRASRWVARPSSVGQTTATSSEPTIVGQTAASSSKPTIAGQTANRRAMQDQEITDILLPKKCSGFEVISRRRFYRLKSLAELAERAARKQIPPTRRVMVLRDLHPDTLLKDSEAAWCRIFGGFLTSVAWLRDAIDQDRPPMAIPLRGISTRRTLVLYFTKQFKEQCKQSSVALTILAQESRMVSVVDSLAEVRKHCVAYKVKHGKTSQPWSSIVILVAEGSEVEPVRHEAGADVPPQVVRTLEEFLTKYSVVQKDLACPGHWRSNLC